jgi:VWFA-related protein
LQLRHIIPAGLACITAVSHVAAQTATQDQTQPVAPTPTITTQSTLVLVPALVHDKSGQLVFNLKVDDFTLTDNGIPQKLRLEQDSGGEPLALVVCIEGGGEAVAKIDRFVPLIAMLEAIAGGVPHRIAVVGFDSSPVLVTNFTSDNDAAERGIKALIQDNNGDGKGAILDSLAFSLDLLRKQPPAYRRAILLLSETHDNGSHIAIDDAMRNLSDSNTAIYSIAFSSTVAQAKHEAAKISQPDTPGPAHGCFSRNPNDPNVDLSKSAAQQDLDCLDLLAPPLALARAAFVAIRGSLQQNIPEAAARLTGGEYFTLGNQKQFERDLLAISNHISNRYVLSFQPQAPRAGYHVLKLSVPGYAHLQVAGRTGYWAEPAHQSSSPSQ